MDNTTDGSIDAVAASLIEQPSQVEDAEIIEDDTAEQVSEDDTEEVSAEDDAAEEAVEEDDRQQVAVQPPALDLHHDHLNDHQGQAGSGKDKPGR